MANYLRIYRIFAKRSQPDGNSFPENVAEIAGMRCDPTRSLLLRTALVTTRTGRARVPRSISKAQFNHTTAVALDMHSGYPLSFALKSDLRFMCRTRRVLC